MSYIEWSDFERVELRAGTIVRVEDFPEAKKPAYKVWVNLGELGVKKSSAQITKLYSKEELLGKQVLCVANFRPKQVANFMSEVLITGFVLQNGEVVLAIPERKVPEGTRLA
ncbi:MAG: tRNA-binding protein [Conexivisphaerales archaeon]